MPITPLCDAAIAGDAEEFSRAYDRYSPDLYGFLLRMLGDADDAQNALQDTFLTAWANARSFDSAQGDELEWLKTIARNRWSRDPTNAQPLTGENVEPVTPPPRVRGQLLEELGERDRAITMERPLPSSRPRWLLTAAAAAFLLALWGITELRVRALREETLALRAQVDQLTLERAQLAETMAALSGSTRTIPMSGQAAAPKADGHVFLDTVQHRAFAFFHALPENPAGKTYQLWIMRADQPGPQSGGVFNADARGNASLALQNLSVETIAGFAVTLEPKGGAPAPTGEKFLVGQ